MTQSSDSGSFEDFLHWLGKAGREAQIHRAPPSREVLVAAQTAWQEFQSMSRDQSHALAARIRNGTYVEELELLAAAEVDREQWLPRLRTPNGFAISALYAANSPPGAAPVGLLVECPVELIAVCRGQPVHVAAGGQWVEIGEIDVDGKAMGDLPSPFAFKPPFSFRVGKFSEELTELPKPDASE